MSARFLSAALLAWLLSSTPTLLGQGQPLGFEETFALSTDRAATLNQLIPGTPEAYRYTCLALQHAGAYDQVPAVLAMWRQRHGRTSASIEIERRQALLTFDVDPRASYAYLRDEMGIRLDHQREIPGAVPDLPTALDPALLEWEALAQLALQRFPDSLGGFENRALPALLDRELSDARWMDLLSRLETPDHEGLAELVSDNLRTRNSRGFGSLGIHGQLTVEQLDTCARLTPDLLANSQFVANYVRRLRPAAGVDWQNDVAEREAYLVRLEAFARRLRSSQNGLLAHVLYHRLVHDHAQGVHDTQRFVDYLALPRNVAWTDPKRLTNTRSVVSLREAYPTGLSVVIDDEALVRAYLEHDFLTAEDTERYTRYLRTEVLRRVFAETKILYGLGDMERWYAMLDDPVGYEALKDRVEIEFAPTQPERFGIDAPVFLDVDLKNVGTLLVKVFEIDAFDIYAERGEEIDASLDLDGLVAHEESTLTLDEPPLRRVRQRFDFPSMDRPGVWVVELIGNGLSSRAVIRKGGVRATERQGAAGHVFRVYDESGMPLPDASIWFGGRDYTANERGQIVLPYSTDSGTKQVVMRHGTRVGLQSFEHARERYSLRVNAWLDRENLLPGAMGRLVVRPRLLLNERPASLTLLDDPVLALAATNSDGVTTSSEMTDLELTGAGDLVHEFRVPEGLTSLTVSLRGSVKSLSLGTDVDMEDAAPAFELSGIRRTSETTALMLSQTPAGYVLEARGRNGEPAADRVVRLALKHRDFRNSIQAQLKTDAIGLIHLGALPDILTVTIENYPGPRSTWELVPQRRTRPDQMRALEGQTIRVPYDGEATEVSRAVVSLLELRDGAIAHDRAEHVVLAGGFLELRDLPAADYELRVEDGRTLWTQPIELTVVRGTARHGWAVSRDELAPLDEIAPLQVTGLDVEDDALRVRLAHARPDARVHVVATRNLPTYHPFGRMYALDARRESTVWSPAAGSTYDSGREIGDESRYILERRFATIFPGNMLQRPTLLLNPWELREAETAVGVAGGSGGGFGRAGKAGSRGKRAGRSHRDPDSIDPNPGEFPDLSYLPSSSIIVANLRPDEAGTVRVPLADLGDGRLLHVLAVDANSTVYRSLALEPQLMEPRDVRLATALPSDAHVSEQRMIEILPPGAAVVVEDVSTSELELYDTLGAVFQLYSTLDPTGELDAWRFLTDWPDRTRDEQLDFYDEFACHELHLFLHEKDPTFFEEIVRPYLAHKASKTFVDEWLLESDLGAYLEPFAWSRLNVLERILLARRVPAEAVAVTRRIAEELDLLPPDPDGTRRLFEAALLGSALDADDDFEGAVRDAKKTVLTGRGRAAGQYVGAPAGSKGAGSVAPPTNPAAAEAAGPAESLRALGYTDGAARSGGASLAADAAMRDELRSLYRGPGSAKAYVEHDYWHRRIHVQDAGLLTPNAFWLDFARAGGDRPFLSTHIAAAGRHVNEMLLALAVLDLPFTAGEHVTETDGGRMTLTPAGPALLVRKELAPAEPDEHGAPLLVGQEVFRADERYRYEGNQRRESYVEGELLTGVVYGSQVVVSNPTSEPRSLELLLQVPQGSIPVSNGRMTRGMDLVLPPLGSVMREVFFYFPEAGDFPMYPAHVSHDGLFLAAGTPRTLHVVSEPSTVDETSWDHISQNGTLDQVLSFVESRNPGRLDYGRIAWRMRDQGAFDQVLAALRGRHLFDRTLWGYGLAHEDARTTGELLQMEGHFLASCGPLLDSPLVTIDPVERRLYEHVEFDPLINERAHPFGGERRILNTDFAAQYQAFLKVMSYRPRLDEADWLEVTYYLMLQDRTEEALAAFGRVDRDSVEATMQHDYAAAYLDFFTEDHALARGIAEPYRDHPVPRWRHRFLDVLHQLDEVDGAGVSVADPDDRVQSQTALAAEEPSLEMSMADGRVTLSYANLAECVVGYYAMDIEFLFSTSPFGQADGDIFSAIVPNRRETLTLEPGSDETVFELPEMFRGSNVLVEVRGGGVVRRQALYANSMTVQMIETYGQVKVTDASDGRPLPRVYVKVYARAPGGGTRFHKDGYTDLRGRFDYVAHSGEGLGTAEAYAVLVLSEEHGAVIREVAPPAR